MPRPEDEPVAGVRDLEEHEPDAFVDEREPSEDERDEVPGSVGPSSPLDSGLFWLS